MFITAVIEIDALKDDDRFLLLTPLPGFGMARDQYTMLYKFAATAGWCMLLG